MHQQMLSYIIATTLEHQRSGRREVMEGWGPADLSGLTPRALFAPHPVPHIRPPSMATERPQ